MSDWMNCPLQRIIVSFATGDILTGLEEYADEIGLSSQQKKDIWDMRKSYHKEHYRLSVKLHNKVEEIRSIFKKDSLTDSDRKSLLVNVDEHTAILNDIERLFINVVFETFQRLEPSQVAYVRSKIDKKNLAFNGAKIIGAM